MPAQGTAREEDRRATVRQALGALSGLLPVGIVAVDPQGRSWYHNQRWEDVSGSTGKSLRGQPWMLAVHPDDAEQVAGEWRSPVGTRGRFGPFRAVSSDGVVHQCRGESVPMLSPAGDVTGYLIVVVDHEPDELLALSSTHFLDVILDRSMDIITILNADGSWRWSSGGALRLLGHVADFDPSQGIFQFMHPDEVEDARVDFEKLVESRRNGRTVNRVRAADGTWRHMESLVDVLVDDPVVHGVVIHTRDVTEQIEGGAALVASHRRLVDLIASMRSAVVMEDEQRRVVVANQSFVNMLRLRVKPEELEGRTLASMGIDADDFVSEPAQRSLIDRVISSHERRVEGIRFTMVDGRIIECDYTPIFVEETFSGHLLMMFDITDRARAEAEQQRLLASEREENRRLAELDAYKSEFLASVSHELRTPLTSIVASTQLLEQMVEQRGDPDELAIIEVIQRNIGRLLRLSGDLLILDSIESGALPITVAPVDVPALVRGAMKGVRPVAETQGVTLHLNVSEGPPLRGDVDRLGQLFDNLLSNAVKFTPAGGDVTLEAAPTIKGWRIEVTDTGIGIPADEQALLFQRFFRGSNVTRSHIPGAGLGLSIAQAIVELHWGTISVHSELGTGTTVSVIMRGIEEQGEAPEPVPQFGRRKAPVR